MDSFVRPAVRRRRGNPAASDSRRWR